MGNFNKDWNNGIAIGALVDAVAPGLFPQWEGEDPKNAVENARAAMQLAEEWLGVPQVCFCSIFLLMSNFSSVYFPSSLK